MQRQMSPPSFLSLQPLDPAMQRCELITLPPISQVTNPLHMRGNCDSSSAFEIDMSRRSSVFSTMSSVSSGFQSARSASPASSTSTLESQYGVSTSFDRLRLSTGHIQTFPYTNSVKGAVTTAPHAGGKASKKKRQDRKQFSKRPIAGTTSSGVCKSDSEAGSRYCQALDQADLARVCIEANHNIVDAAARRHGGSGWVWLKTNNISSDVRQDGIEPSCWNKSSVNGSAILIIEHSNALLQDVLRQLDSLSEQAKGGLLSEQIEKEISRYKDCVAAATSSRGEADWREPTERMKERMNE